MSDGANTITININVGTAETNGTGAGILISTDTPITADQKNESIETDLSSEKMKTVYVTKTINMVDVIEIMVICAMAVHLFKDKWKGNSKDSYEKKD